MVLTGRVTMSLVRCRIRGNLVQRIPFPQYGIIPIWATVRVIHLSLRNIRRDAFACDQSEDKRWIDAVRNRVQFLGRPNDGS